MLRRSRIACAVTAYLTDVEGSTAYWDKYLAMSAVLQRCATTGRVLFRPQQASDAKFVYGGDAFDKGAGDDLVFASDLMQLKEDYPDRVTLIGGNRDFNKMNYGSYFHDAYIASMQNVVDVPIPFFMAASPQAVSYASYLQKHAPMYPTDRATKLSYFMWRIEHTMGIQGGFEKRRQYLQNIKGSPVSDEECMASFIDSAAPGGVVYRYLDHIQIAAVVDGTLFVHGAINAANAGFVPTRSLKEGTATTVEGDYVFAQHGSVDEWVDRLNAFGREGIADWKRSPAMDPVTGLRGGGFLAAYNHNKSTMGRTVVVPTFTSKSAPQPPLTYVDLGIVEHLNHSGVFRVCVGHKPVGDVPATIQQPGLSIHIVDNSYCGGVNGGVDGRGAAVQEVLLDGAEGTARCHGRRSDGTPFDFDMDDPVLGIPTSIADADGKKKTWWSSAVLSDGNVLLHSTDNDYFSIQYKTMGRDELSALQAQDPLTSAGEGEFMHRYERHDLKPMKRKVVPPS